MPKFVTIHYGDVDGYKQTAPAVRDAAHAHDRDLAARGALIGIARSPTQVRNPGDGGVETTSGAFMTSALPLAGLAIIEAKDEQEAITLVSQTPCAVAHGVVEVWPVDPMPG